MQEIFDTLSIIVREGLLPNLTLLVDFLLGEGLFLGLGIIFLPLLGKVIQIFKKIF